uniref:AAA+ ATPase domain-containing protein n=1 Tax=Lepeophtheirus salmonis TaxID=72036 RepID=A0A0K2T9J2_LEPSM
MFGIKWGSLARVSPRLYSTLRASPTLRREIRGLERILMRSPTFVQSLEKRLFSMSSSLSQEDKKSDKKEKDAESKDESGKSNKKEEEEEKMNSEEEINKEKKILIRSFLQMAIPLMIFYVLLSSMGGGSPSSPVPQQPQNSSNRIARDITWTEFYHNMLLVGEVEKVVIYPQSKRALVHLYPSAIYKGKQLNSLENVFRLEIPPSTNLEDKIRDAEYKLGIGPGGGLSIVYDRGMEDFSKFIAAIIACIAVAAIFYIMKSVRFQMTDQISGITKADFTLINSKIRSGKGTKFSDVAGLHEAKIEVKEFVDYLKNPTKYRELGAKPPKGAILLGPPGCGKTLLAKAVANEASVPFLSMNGSEFIEMIGGVGAARVRSLFAEARKRAPSIVYIDEIDAVGRERGGTSGSSTGGGGGSGESEQTLNQLLVEMDGMSSKHGVIMLASTNRSDVLDKALLRPGRFDRHISIDLPTVIERKEILEQHMKSVVLDEESSKYSERLATLTPGFSGAELANLINEAALHAARYKHSKIGLKNLEYAVERVVAGAEKKSSSISIPERRIIAYHEAGHALVGWLLEHTDSLLKVTILPRTSMVLGFAQYTPVDKKLFSPEELMDRMCMALGGRVAESVIFNRITTGAQNDLDKVTKMAYAQIREFGFNEVVGNVSYEPSTGKPMYSRKLQGIMDLEARKLIAKSYKITEELLIKNKDLLEKLAEKLLEKETLNYDDVVEILGPPRFKNKNFISPSDYEASLRRQADLGSSQETSI